jgi:hypothetical protein
VIEDHGSDAVFVPRCHDLIALHERHVLSVSDGLSRSCETFAASKAYRPRMRGADVMRGRYDLDAPSKRLVRERLGCTRPLGDARSAHMFAGPIPVVVNKV